MCLLRGTDWVFIYNSGYVFCVDLRTNSVYFPIQHSLTCLYNRDGVCLLRGTGWIFKYNRLMCVFDRLILYVETVAVCHVITEHKASKL